MILYYVHYKVWKRKIASGRISLDKNQQFLIEMTEDAKIQLYSIKLKCIGYLYKW